MKEITASGDIKYGDIAVLSRAWAPLDVYADVLAAAGIPAVHAGGGSLLTTREALDAVAVIDFLSYPHDDIPLVTILRSPFFAVSDKSLYFFAEEKRDPNLSWWDGLARTDIPELKYPYSILFQVRETKSSKAPSESLKYLDQLTGYSAVVANLPHGPRREADWHGILALLHQQEQAGRPDAFSLSRFLKQLVDAEIDIPRPPLNAHQAVSLMTIHKAKGLEWPVVFIPDLSRDVKANTIDYLILDAELGVAFKLEGDDPDRDEPSMFTLFKKRRTDREYEESKRVLYVAMTRAEDKVVISATKEKGYAIDLLRPGLDAAGIVDEPIPYQDKLAIPPAPAEPAPFKVPETIQVEPIKIGLRSIPVTALTTYAKCGEQFRFRYVLGHPGMGEGSTGASSVGTLAHSALEHDIDTVEGLRERWIDIPDDQLTNALDLARAYRIDAAFAGLREQAAEKEVSFRFRVGGLSLFGTADVVGPDFVLDYKTDSRVHPDEHRFQLWVYARALGKSTAYIAYLRHNILHKINADQLSEIDSHVEGLIEGIVNGTFLAAPREETCRWCSYKEICSFAFAESNTQKI